jgi:parallel beta-helix repeat protein
MKRKASALALILALLLSAVGTQFIKKAGAKAIVVPDEYATIQEAINAATTGDTIFVRGATYHENIVVNKTVSLVGENKETTIIDGYGVGTYVVTITADNIHIMGFKIQGGGNGTSVFNSAGVIIEENIITGMSWFAIALLSSHQNTIRNNTLIRNQVGIGLLYSNNNTVANNWIEDSGGSSIWLGYSANNCFDSNIIKGNRGFSALYIDWCTDSTFIRNEISLSQEWSMYLAFYSNGKFFTENTFLSNQRGFLFHEFANNNTFHHNNFFNTFEMDNQDCMNTWDNGYPSGGNFWSDYNGTDANGDGIGDIPYEINENNTDRYPLMSPVGNFPQPTPTPSPSPSPSPSPAATPSPQPTPTPSPTLSPSPEPTPTLSPEPQPEPEPFPPTLVIASVITLAVVGIGLLVYFKKRKC